MCKIRVKREGDFSVIPNSILRDKNLTPKARFLLIFCLSLADTWDYNIRGLATVVGCGVDAITSGLKELETNGYLIREQHRSEDGTFGSSDYILFETPYTKEPCRENQCTEMPPLYNTNKTNTKETNTNRHSIPSSVAMTDNEYQKLVALAKDESFLLEVIECASSWKENPKNASRAKKIKNNYLFLRNWLKREMAKTSSKLQQDDVNVIWNEVAHRLRGSWSVDGWSSPALMKAVKRIGFSRLQQCSTYELESIKKQLFLAYKEELNG